MVCSPQWLNLNNLNETMPFFFFFLPPPPFFFAAIGSGSLEVTCLHTASIVDRFQNRAIHFLITPDIAETKDNLTHIDLSCA